jgi:glutamyl endopeptidase
VRPGHPGNNPNSPNAESIIGADGRSLVRNTSTYPNSAIGHLSGRFGPTQFSCTGFLIDSNSVLTTADCLHSGGAGGVYAEDVVFSPGRGLGGAGGELPFGSCFDDELIVSHEWTTAARERENFGILQLDCTVGGTTGWLGLVTEPGTRALEGKLAHVRGYPGTAGGTQWTHRDRVRVSTDHLLFHGADTTAGQAGSPIFNWRTGCLTGGGEGPCAMGVHALGPHGSAGPHAVWNHGSRLSRLMYNLIVVVAGFNGP